MKKIAKLVLVILVVAVLAVGLLASRIYSYRNASSDAQADATVVLGAAVWTANVSPSSASLTRSTRESGTVQSLSHLANCDPILVLLYAPSAIVFRVLTDRPVMRQPPLRP